MRILFAIPHYFEAGSGGSVNKSRRRSARRERARALLQTVLALHRLFGDRVYGLDHHRRRAWPFASEHACDVVVCTAGDRHLVDRIPALASLVQRRETDSDPALLGFECHRLMKERAGQYDWFCYVEDDVVLTDPLTFGKLALFNETFGDESLLQPNRYEVATSGPVLKLYCDYHIRPGLTRRWQDVNEQPTLTLPFLGDEVRFHRTCYPSAGSFFLNAAQLDTFVRAPAFLDGDVSYMSSLDSAATLGILKTFRIYKPAPRNASFLEVLHASPRWISVMGTQAEIARSAPPALPWDDPVP